MSFIWQSIDGMGRVKLKLGMGPIPIYHQSKGCVLKEYKFCVLHMAEYIDGMGRVKLKLGMGAYTYIPPVQRLCVEGVQISCPSYGRALMGWVGSN